ncbi:MAG: hypothetical protein ACKOXP_08705 [Flavobacteriales bacterium]
MWKFIIFSAFILSFALQSWTQDALHFNGTLTYRIERVDVNDSVQAKMILFARDSLLKIVHFSSNLGRQETIKHLIYQKKYVLIETEQGKFAVQMKDSVDVSEGEKYTFESCRGKAKIAGVKGKKMKLIHPQLQHELNIVYTPSISAKYLDAFAQLPGLALEYYVVSEAGLFKYTLESIDRKTPPLSLFMIPSDYQKISLKAFREMSAKSASSINRNN